MVTLSEPPLRTAKDPSRFRRLTPANRVWSPTDLSLRRRSATKELTSSALLPPQPPEMAPTAAEEQEKTAALRLKTPAMEVTITAEAAEKEETRSVTWTLQVPPEKCAEMGQTGALSEPAIIL
jgi:hypothetical protein